MLEQGTRAAFTGPDVCCVARKVLITFRGPWETQARQAIGRAHVFDICHIGVSKNKMTQRIKNK